MHGVGVFVSAHEQRYYATVHVQNRRSAATAELRVSGMCNGQRERVNRVRCAYVSEPGKDVHLHRNGTRSMQLGFRLARKGEDTFLAGFRDVGGTEDVAIVLLARNPGGTFLLRRIHVYCDLSEAEVNVDDSVGRSAKLGQGLPVPGGVCLRSLRRAEPNF